MHQRRAERECGGTPDAMLLPRLADYFNVSVDYLFGRGKHKNIYISHKTLYLSCFKTLLSVVKRGKM